MSAVVLGTWQGGDTDAGPTKLRRGQAGTGPSLFLLPGRPWAPVTTARATRAGLQGSRPPPGRPTGKERPSWSWRGRSPGRRSPLADSRRVRILPLPRRLTKKPQPLPGGFQLGSAKRRHQRQAEEGGARGGALAPASPHWGAPTEPHPARRPPGGPRNAPLSARPPGRGTGDGDAPSTSTSGRCCLHFGDNPPVSATQGELASRRWTHLLL